MSGWIAADDSVPADARPCVVLVISSHGFYEREFGQFSGGKWSYMGSDSKLRGVEYWLPLPSLPPLPEVRKLGGVYRSAK